MPDCIKSQSVAKALLEDDDFDPKEYAMAGPVNYHPVYAITTRAVRAWFLKHYHAPVKSVYRDKLGQIHGYAVDREGVFYDRQSYADAEFNVRCALETWLHQAVRDGDRISAFIHYYVTDKRIYFDLLRDDDWTRRSGPRNRTQAD